MRGMKHIDGFGQGDPPGPGTIKQGSWWRHGSTRFAMLLREARKTEARETKSWDDRMLTMTEKRERKRVNKSPIYTPTHSLTHIHTLNNACRHCNTAVRHGCTCTPLATVVGAQVLEVVVVGTTNVA